MTEKVVSIEEKSLAQIEAEAREQGAAQAKRQAAIENEAKAKAELASKFQIRALKGDDLFKLLSLLGSLEIKDEFVEMYVKNVEQRYDAQREAIDNLVADHKDKKLTKAETKAKQIAAIDRNEETEKNGVEIMGMLLDKVMKNIYKIKIELNEFIGGLVGLTADEVADLPINEYMYLISAVIKSEDFTTFFKSTASLLG